MTDNSEDDPCKHAAGGDKVLTSDEEELVEDCHLHDPAEAYTNLFLQHIMDSLVDLDLSQAADLPSGLHDVPRYEKSRALVMAARRGYTDCVSWLITSGANPNAEDDYGYTALMFMAAQGLDAGLRELLAHQSCMVNKRTGSQQTALHFAAEKGRCSSAQILLDAGALVNAADDWGETPLILAVNSGSVATVTTLLQHGAHLDKTDLRGFDAFMYAARNGHVDVLNLLLASGADAAKSGKTTALHEAARFGHAACVRALLEAGAETNVRDVHDVLPIELATQTDQAEVVKCLLLHGEVQQRDTACQNKSDNSQSELDSPQPSGLRHNSKVYSNSRSRRCGRMTRHHNISHHDQRNAALAAAAICDAGKCLRLVLEHGADPSATDRHGVPAYFLAVAQNNVDVVVTLIQHNCLVNRAVSKVYFYNSELWPHIHLLGCDSITALHIAILRGFPNLVRILITAGAPAHVFLRLLDDGHVPEVVTMDTGLMQWVKERCVEWSAVMPLREMCRQCIRSQLSKPGGSQIRELPLPPLLQDFLAFTELNDLITSARKPAS